MPSQALLSKKILIVDDEPVNVMILEQMLQEGGYQNVCGLTNPAEALASLETYAPDLIVLDLRMPVIDGFQVMENVRAHTPEGVYLPILVVTADVVQESRRRALTAGATDFLTKPFDETEVLLRIENLLRTRWQYLLLQDKNMVLDQKVFERTRELEQAQLETLQRLALAAEYRDDDTGLHTRRVGLTAARIAAALGLSADQVDLILRAAPLHDVGKIGITDAILLKPGKLTDEEFATMKQHTVIGAGMLSGSTSPWLQLAEEIAISHHERWDGKGYPHGLSGTNIPLVGRIVAVADVFDALTHERPYKKAWLVAEAMAELESKSGSQFDPDVLRVFLALPGGPLL